MKNLHLGRKFIGLLVCLIALYIMVIMTKKLDLDIFGKIAQTITWLYAIFCGGNVVKEFPKMLNGFKNKIGGNHDN